MSEFQCAHSKPGWDANHPPDEHTELIEVKISFAKLAMKLAPGRKIGLAFAVADASGSVDHKWYGWLAGGREDRFAEDLGTCDCGMKLRTS
jgi:hypothetical protein